MKKIENNFIVTGYVGKDAEIRQFTTASGRPLFHSGQPSGKVWR